MIDMKSENSRIGAVCLEMYSRIDGTEFLGRIYAWVSEEGFHKVLIYSVNAVLSIEDKNNVLDNHRTCRQRSDSEHLDLEQLSSVPPAQD